MRELSASEQTILDALDEELQKVEKKLRPFQELIEQQQRLTKVKAALLNERVGGPRSTSSGHTQLTHEQVTQAFLKLDKRYMTVAEIAKQTGAPDSTVRSHLHRGKQAGTYKKHKDGEGWRLVGDE